ncbi:hypothetical protein [Couchioplanes azureus]|uniref:hypothetical protein n=1 Tax=Couchioplanes caeruleus TaxID=56438 RepID=UPI00166FCEFC|nr:hypothetical protein [Couchioplanes caeruleus]GGQ41978.1 hypothetical protein GCM10010166_07150 [Couchioplanes caeruleus subsp. azureus]
MTDEPIEVEEPAETSGERENKGSVDQPWGPDEQRYSERPEQGGEAPGPVNVEPPD